MEVLASHADKREYEEFKIQAALHGAEIKDKPSFEKPENDDLLFRDPKEYENLSEEERKELTDKMMAAFKGKFANTSIG
jgi:hypothetical protein